MESKVLLGKILKSFKDKGVAKVEGYNSFGYLRETDNSVFVKREQGDDTKVPFANILKGIDAYKTNPQLYNQTPTALREFGITHVTSPVFAMLHLLEKEDYN